jgi:hypothetical protein
MIAPVASMMSIFIFLKLSRLVDRSFNRLIGFLLICQHFFPHSSTSSVNLAFSPILPLMKTLKDKLIRVLVPFFLSTP